jgi:hypothetical protein
MKKHNEKLNDFQSLENVIKVTKSRKMKQAGLVVSVGQLGNAFSLLAKKPGGRSRRIIIIIIIITYYNDGCPQPLPKRVLHRVLQL